MCAICADGGGGEDFSRLDQKGSARGPAWGQSQTPAEVGLRLAPHNWILSQQGATRRDMMCKPMLMVMDLSIACGGPVSLCAHVLLGLGAQARAHRAEALHPRRAGAQDRGPAAQAL